MIRNPVCEFPDYEVSSGGTIFSLKGINERPLKAPINSRGYRVVVLYDGHGGKRTKSVHQVVLESFVGPKPSGAVARHLNGDKTDNRLENLSWGSLGENSADRFLHFAISKEKKDGIVKLADPMKSVPEIRAMYASGVSCKEIADKFGISRSHAKNVATGRCWAMIPGITGYGPTKFEHESFFATETMLSNGAVICAWALAYNRREDGRLEDKPQNMGVVIRKNAVIGSNSVIHRGSWRNTVIGRGSRIGSLVNLGHNCIIGENALIAPLVSIAGSCNIGKNVTIWQGAMIHQKVTIGEGAVIGMGAIILADVPAHKTVVGVWH